MSINKKNKTDKTTMFDDNIDMDILNLDDFYDPEPNQNSRDIEEHIDDLVHKNKIEKEEEEKKITRKRELEDYAEKIRIEQEKKKKIKDEREKKREIKRITYAQNKKDKSEMINRVIKMFPHIVEKELRGHRIELIKKADTIVNEMTKVQSNYWIQQAITNYEYFFYSVKIFVAHLYASSQQSPSKASIAYESLFLQIITRTISDLKKFIKENAKFSSDFEQQFHFIELVEISYNKILENQQRINVIQERTIFYKSAFPNSGAVKCYLELFKASSFTFNLLLCLKRKKLKVIKWIVFMILEYVLCQPYSLCESKDLGQFLKDEKKEVSVQDSKIEYDPEIGKRIYALTRKFYNTPLMRWIRLYQTIGDIKKFEGTVEWITETTVKRENNK